MLQTRDKTRWYSLQEVKEEGIGIRFLDYTEFSFAGVSYIAGEVESEGSAMNQCGEEQDIKERIELANAAADRVVCEMLACRKDLTLERTADYLGRYIRYRYLLDDEAADERSIDALAYLSVKKIMRETNGNLNIAGVSGSCSGLGSPAEKRILTFVVMQRKLGIKMNPKDAAEVETLDDLAKVVLPLLQEEG